MDQEASEKIRALEERVNWLTFVVIALAIGLTPIAGLIPLAIVGFLVALPILAFTHQWLSRIARHCGKLISFFSKLLNTSHPMRRR